MKMIASTKVAKAQRGMESARTFGVASSCKYSSKKKVFDRHVH